MILDTRHFGEITIDEERIIAFNGGLPGFPQCKRFILLQQESNMDSENGCAFWWLQSIDQPETAFVLVDVFQLMPAYNPLIDAGQISGLGAYDPETFLVYNVANIPEDVRKLTVNLKAPIVINAALREGRQVIVNNDEYGVKHYLFEEVG